MIASNKSFKEKVKKGVIGALVRNFNKNSCSSFATATTNSSLAPIRIRRMQMQQKQNQKLELFFHSSQFGIGLFVYMRPNFQSLFSRLDIFYPSMLTKPKGKQITACNLNKVFPSGWSIIKNFPQRTQSIAKISSRLFAPFSNLPWTTCKLQLPIHIRRTAKYI